VRSSSAPLEVTPQAGILHADLDAFYASVEQRDNPRLRNTTMAVGGGVILAASYEARAMGVRTAMNIRQARECCPSLITVPPRMEAYSEASRAVFEIFDDTTPLVEAISIDEAFLDVSGLERLSGPPVEVARLLRARVADEVGLAISVGVARTKFLAKVASGACKPDGLLVVEPDGETDFLHPLPVNRLWGVGRVTSAKLGDRGIHTVGDVAAMEVGALAAIVGRGSGSHLHDLANGKDVRRVETAKRRSSVGAQQAMPAKQRTSAELVAVLEGLVDRVTKRLRDGDRVGRTVVLRFRFGDFTRDTRSHTVSEPTASTATLLGIALEMLEARRDEISERNLTLLGFTIANLSSADAIQQALPFDNRSDPELDSALDAIRDRFGSSSISRAANLGQDQFSVPLLPDPK